MTIIPNFTETKITELDNLKREKDKMTSDMSVVHDQYKQLNTQLEAMQNLFNEYQVCDNVSIVYQWQTQV